ncbi:TPA: DNA/RNA helicase domain-containing protein [Bacillus albus]
MISVAAKLSSFEIIKKKRKDFEQGSMKDFEIDRVPVVYIQRDKKNLYVGKSTDIYERFVAHLCDESKTFNEVIVIKSELFNESSIKHIETLLIEYLSADDKFNLLNKVRGQKIHTYNGIENVQSMFKRIWNQLIEEGIASEKLGEIHNKFIYKYSPFKDLSANQIEVCKDIFNTMLTTSNSRHLITGDPGTGKTIVLTNILYALAYDNETGKAREGLNYEDIALVVPQTHSLNLYKSLMNKLGLQSITVLSPSQFIKQAKGRGTKYKYVFVDEAHRLKQYFGKQARDLKHLVTDNGYTTELELIETFAYHLTVVYDPYQTIRPADIDTDVFQQLTVNYKRHPLHKQFRLKSGEQYLAWLRKYLQIANNVGVYEEGLLQGYDFKVMDSITELNDSIKSLNKEYELCRVVAGYSWKWATQKDKNLYDIKDPVTGNTFIWNSKVKDWINFKNSVEEIGCIHTTQGADLNYIGVILGAEIDCYYTGEENGDYDLNKAKIIVNPKEYKDRNGLPIKGTDLNNVELTSYIKRIYYVLLSRGINGCYVYAVNQNMQRYLKQIVKVSQ